MSYIDGDYKDYDYVSGLDAGRTKTTYFLWTANKCGNVQVKAVADATDAVDEGSNEGNNERTKTVSVTCQDQPITSIVIEGRSIGCEDYAPLNVFFRGSEIPLKLQGLDKQEYTFVGERWVDRNSNLNIETVDELVEVSDFCITTNKDEFTMKIPENIPIGLYRLKIKGTVHVSIYFWVIYSATNRGLSEEDIQNYWKDEFTGGRVGFRPEVKTSHHKASLMICMASAASYLEYGDPDEPEHYTLGNFHFWLDRHLKPVSSAVPPSDILSYATRIIEGDKPNADCDCFATFGVSLARAAGIPARAIHGLGIESSLDLFWSHCWVEPYYYTAWQVWDPPDKVRFEQGDFLRYNHYVGYIHYQFNKGNLVYLLTAREELGKWRSSDYGGNPLLVVLLSCPVHATITDQYGRIVSDDGTNEIPDADMITTNGTKIFYLPADLTYFVEIDAYDSGTFNFTRFSPIGNDILITKFENIPVTSNTKASVEIEPGVTDYTMSVDYNGDGVTDEEKSPDVSETIVNVGPENDYAKDSYIKVVSGTIAGQDINPNNPEITVSSAKKISGSFDISVRNTGHPGSIFPIVANPNWGPHESSYWSITGHQAPGIKTHTVNVDLNAPSKPGVYYIIVAGMWELSAANVASGTNWVVGENHWNDGNDLADWSTSMIEQAIKSGLVIADWEKVEGMVKMYVPATAIRVKVVTEKPKAWLHSGYDLDNTRFYPYPSKTSVTNFDVVWTSPNKGKILTGDINGDGELELVSAFEERVCAMDKNGVLLWSNNVATDSGISGAKIKSMDLADMDGDTIPEIVVGISPAVPYPHVNKPLRILFYDGAGNLLKTISTPNSHVIDVKCADLNNDGRKEVIATIQAWYTLKPRGVYVYDYTTGNELWHYNIGPQLWIDSIADINNDGNKEIVVGTFAPHNGNSDHGTDDSHSYVFAFDEDGNNLWTKQIGWDSVYSSVADLNNDGKPEIISFRNQNEPYYPGANDVYILNPANGNIVDTYNGPANKGWKGWAIADINGDGKKEIVVGNRDGTLRVLDYNLNFIDSCSLSGTVQAINDVNGDGKQEIIVCTDDKRIVILNDDLSEARSYKLGAKGNAIVSDLIPGGANELIVSADKLYVFSGIEGSVPGDVTGDGRVDYKDLTGIIEHFGAIDTKYDVDRSGTVGYPDVNFILDHWTASKPYGRATTTVKGPVTVPLGSSFKVLIKTDGTVEAAHISVIFPSELNIESINVDPDVDFDFSTYQNGTDWIDVMVAEAPGLPTGYPEAPLLAEICFTATEEGTYTIDLSSVLNGEANDVEALTVEVEVEAESIDTTLPVVISVEQSNDSPEQGEDVTITAHVTDNIGVTSVTEKGGYWSATIPGQPTCTTLCISVTASDAAGNTATFWPHGKHWVDTIAPAISNMKVSPTYALPGDSINISAGVFYSSGIRWVRAFISKGGEDVGTIFMSDSDGDGVYTGTWQTMNFTESGTYNIDISATDTDGNEALAKGPEIEIA